LFFIVPDEYFKLSSFVEYLAEAGTLSLVANFDPDTLPTPREGSKFATKESVSAPPITLPG
jgi:hypothetical protein